MLAVIFMPPTVRLDPRHELEGDAGTRMALGLSLGDSPYDLRGDRMILHLEEVCLVVSI